MKLENENGSLSEEHHVIRVTHTNVQGEHVVRRSYGRPILTIKETHGEVSGEKNSASI